MSAFYIRTLRPDDEHRLLQFERDNRTWFEARIDPRGDAFYTRDGVRDHIEQYLDGYARATWHPCVIVDRTDAIVGRANLKDIDLATGMAEIGYRIAQQHAGQGLATDAVAPPDLPGALAMGAETAVCVHRSRECRVGAGSRKVRFHAR